MIHCFCQAAAEWGAIDSAPNFRHAITRARSSMNHVPPYVPHKCCWASLGGLACLLALSISEKASYGPSPLPRFDGPLVRARSPLECRLQ